MELHNRGIYHLVHVQLGSLDGPTNSLDHGKPKRHNRDDDDCSCGTAALPDSLHCLDHNLENVFLWSITAMMPSIMGLRTREENTARGALTPRIPALYIPLQLSLVHTGHDADHHGPANQGKENSARCIATSITSLVHVTATVHLDHTGHDAKHHGPATQEEHSRGAS